MYTEKEQEEYMKIWFSLAEEAGRNGFTWPSLLESEEWNQYMATSMYRMSVRTYTAISKATEEIMYVLYKTYQYITNTPAQFQKLGFPPETWEIARMKHTGLFSYFTRLDFIVKHDDIKLIEVNCDTPTGYLEPSVANEVLCRYHDVNHPNHIEEHVVQAWEQIKHDYKISPDETIYFTSYDWHDEDHQTVQFLRSYCLQQQTDYVGIQDIVVADDGIYTPAGDKIKYLYRLYPIEYLVADTDKNGKRIGLQFLDHIAQGRVQIINPPAAFVMQNKGMLALIWQLYEDQVFFDKEEREIIKKYFLPTYFTNKRFLERKESYVSKPLFGREGGGVSIYDNDELLAEDQTEYYFEQRKIYQQYVDMPDYTIDTWDGPYTGKLLIGSHCISGRAAGLFLRVGEKITGNLSMFIGVTIEG
ncbi:glutathionylspermidine synthase family protein [Bacillus mycoides]|uniref:glutathionylspermidine synthase family protein n=1 Tax=Bacillus mycoides TaxID=1405 RepID=UPI003F74C271